MRRWKKNRWSATLASFPLWLPEQGICISFHCSINGELSVVEVHNICVRLEKQLRVAVPLLGRIIIHMEPDAVSAERQAD